MDDVNEIKDLAIGSEPEKEAFPIVKVKSQICVVPSPHDAAQSFHQLSWQRLTMCLICEAIALGCLSMPSAFATLGMVWGVIATVGIGLVTVYTSLIVAETKYRNPHLKDYAEIGRLLFGNFGYYFVATMLLLLLILTVGSHVLTGIIAFESLFDHKLCSVYFGVISAVLLFILALPKTFDNMAILAYIDFASIAAAVIITIVVSAIESKNKVGGLDATTWYAFHPANQTPGFVQVMLAITNIVLAYAVAQCLPSFMSELKRPQDYKKAIWTLGGMEIAFYTLIGAIIYYYKGQEVKAPALLSINPTMQKVVFGVAMPVIFISGAINGQTAAKFIYDLIFQHSSKHKYMNTRRGVLTWLGLGIAINIVAWVAAEVIPSFSLFLGIMAALFTACFTFTLPACMYFMVLRGEKGRRTSNLTKWVESAFNLLILVGGIYILFVGCACCVISLVREFKAGASAPFAC